MPGFLEDADVASALGKALQLAPDKKLDPFWDNIISAANLEAYQDLLQVFTQRGYYKVIIDQWDNGAFYQRKIALYECLRQVAANQPGQYNLEALKLGDPREKLQKTALTVNGVFQYPGLTTVQTDAGSDVAQVASGPYDGSNDLFGVPLDPNDHRRGRVVRS